MKDTLPLGRFTRFSIRPALLLPCLLAAFLLPGTERAAAQGCAAPPPGLVAWWRGEGNARDEVSGASGTLSGNVTYGPGRVGQGLVFDGNQDGVVVGNPTNLHLQNFTIEAWIRRASPTQVSISSTFGYIFGYDGHGYGFYITTEGQLVLTKAWVSYVVVNPGLTNTNFHHVAVTKSGGTVVFYVDGVAYPAAFYDPGFAFTSAAAIGYLSDSRQGSFLGTIDEVSVYNRPLAAVELQAIYGSGAGGKCLSPISPNILTHPESQVADVGAPAGFTTLAGGTLPLSYQWRKDGQALAGQTGPTLSFAAVQMADAGRYQLVVTNALGAATSRVAVLQVLASNAPSIRINQELAVGTVPVAGVATVTITGGFPGGFVFFTLDGSTPTTSSELYVGNLTLTNNAVIQAMSLSADLSRTALSPPVILQVLPAYGLQVAITGEGTVGANPPTGPYMSNSVVMLTAQGAPHWAFARWEGDLSGSQNPVPLLMNGPRSVRAVFAVSEYPLTVGTAGGGSVTANGQSIAPGTFFAAGGVVSLLATAAQGWTFLRWEGAASGSANPYALVMNQTNEARALFGTVVGSIVSGNGSIQMSTPNPVPFGTQLTVTAVPAPGSRFVTWSGSLSGTNPVASFAVTAATPSVGALFAQLPFPTIVTQPANTSALLGQGASFSVSATGAPPLLYQWRREGIPLAGATGSALVFASVTGADAGGYDVVVENAHGNRATSAVATLTVNAPVTITGNPLPQVVAAGQTAEFHVVATGTPELGYQWLFNGTNLPGATASSLLITNVGMSALGAYHAEVWNAYSAATSAPALLLMSPSIRGAFVGATLTWGKPGSLSVSAIGSPPLSYQWFKDGNAIAGGTSATLDFPVVELSAAGMYSVVISSPYGSVTNPPAQVIVNPANMWLGMYAGVTIEGVPGYSYTIQYSTDLTDTNSWVTATNLTLVQPVELWVDTSVNVHGGNSPKRFYRILAH
jgi:hypothetical protein